MIPGKRLVYMRLMGNENHRKLCMPGDNRIAQLFQNRDGQFNSLAVAIHDVLWAKLPACGVRSAGVGPPPFEKIVQGVVGRAQQIPNAAMMTQRLGNSMNHVPMNVILVENQLILLEREVGLEVAILFRRQIIGYVIVGSQGHDNFVHDEVGSLEQIQQVLLIGAVTGDAEVQDFLIRSVDFRCAEQLILVHSGTPGLGVAKHQHAAFAIRAPVLHLIRTAQPKLILVDHGREAFFLMPGCDVFQGVPTRGPDRNGKSIHAPSRNWADERVPPAEGRVRLSTR